MFRWFRKYFIPHEHNGYHPHFLRHKTISVILLFIVVVEVGFFIQIFYVFDKTKFLAAVLPGVLTSITNEERAELSLPPLTENPLLAQAAQMKAEDMAKNSYFAHTSPEGKTPWYWFDQVGYKYLYAGENLAVNFFESDEVGEAWMNSPTHKANIIKSVYTEIGIGVASGVYEGHRTVFVAQLFGTPLPANTEAIPTPEIETKASPSAVTLSKEEVGPETVVLGEEVVTKTAEPLTNTIKQNITESAKESPVKLTVKEMASTPGRSVGYLYGVLGVFAALAVILALFIRSEVHHPGMVARGVGLVALLVILSVVNFKILESKPITPNTPLGANAIEAFPR